MTLWRWQSFKRGVVVALVCAGVLTGCQPGDAPQNPAPMPTDPQLEPSPPAPLSRGGEAMLIGDARTLDAPALWVSADGQRVIGAWADGDALMVRDLTGDRVVTFPAPDAYAVRIYGTDSGGVHVLWLGMDDDSPAGSGMRLMSVLLNSNLQAQRAPQVVSHRRTTGYSVLEQGNGSLVVVWAGGLVAQATLWAQAVDRTGRVQLPRVLLDSAREPVFFRDGAGEVWLSVIEESTGGRQLLRFEANDIVPGSAMPVIEPPLVDGARVTGFYVASDTRGTYAFWQVTDARGGRSVWWVYGANGDRASWGAPEPLRIAVDGAENAPVVPVSFHVDAVRPAALSGAGVRVESLYPSGDVGDVLPVSAVMGEALVFIFWREGAVVGVRQVAGLTGQSARMVSAPALRVDRQRALTVVWGVPDGARAALWGWSLSPVAPIR